MVTTFAYLLCGHLNSGLHVHLARVVSTDATGLITAVFETRVSFIPTLITVQMLQTGPHVYFQLPFSFALLMVAK